MKKLLLVIASLALVAGCKKKKEEAPAPQKKAAPVMKVAAPKKIEKPKKVEPPKKVKAPIKLVKEQRFTIPKDAKKVEKPVPHLTFTVKGEELVAMDSLTLKAAQKIHGFNKKVPLGVTVVFKKDGEIFKVLITSHKETPDWITRIEKEWISRFDNLKPQSPIVGPKGKSIDALSEATLSTEAIKNATELVRKSYMKNFVKKDAKGKKGGKKAAMKKGKK